jgi:hypothetical protein
MSLLIDTSFLWNETVWNPSMISTALWLDAADATTLFTTDTGSTLVTEGGTVGRWNDKSGNGYHATQATSDSRPQYTSNSVVFAGLKTISVPPAAAQLNNRSLAMVLQTTTTTFPPTGNDASFIAMQAGDNPELRYGTSSGGLNKGDIVRLYWNSNYAIDFNAGLTSAVTLFISELDGNTTPLAATLYKNGASLATGSRNVSAQGTFTQFTIGGYNFYGVVNGTLKELLVYQTNSTNRQKLEGYLAHKWGLGANLPNDHPYKTVGPKP